jgi:homoserine kinase
MKPLEELLSAQEQNTVQTLADYVQDHVHKQWRQVLEENQEELRRLYDEAGETAYRVSLGSSYGRAGAARTCRGPF